MNFLEKLDFLMERYHLNKHTLAQVSGIPYTTIVTFYKSGYANTKLSTLQRLCDVFNVTLDYLCGDNITDPMHGITIESPSADELELNAIFRSLNSEAQSMLLSTARAFAGNPAMKKSAAVG